MIALHCDDLKDSRAYQEVSALRPGAASMSIQGTRIAERLVVLFLSASSSNVWGGLFDPTAASVLLVPSSQSSFVFNRVPSLWIGIS